MRTVWFVLAGAFEAALTGVAHAPTEGQENRMVVWLKRRGRTHPSTALLLLPFWCIMFISCEVPQQANQFTAEEAAYNEDVAPLTTAACGIGTFQETPTNYIITGLEVPGYGHSEGDHSWKELFAKLDTLLPPPGLEEFHAALISTIHFQSRLPESYPVRVDLQAGSKLPTIDGQLAAQARVACDSYHSFLDVVSSRKPTTVATAPLPTLAVSFQPIGSSFSLNLNKSGFSVNVSDSISTPLGSVTVSASDPKVSPVNPTRLVINASSHRRVFLMDRPFKVFVPSEYGVSVANDGQQLTLDILRKPTMGAAQPMNLEAEPWMSPEDLEVLTKALNNIHLPKASGK